MSLSEIETILSGGEIVPQSRIEKIIVGEDIVPQSRIEQLLKEILGGGGGGGGSGSGQFIVNVYNTNAAGTTHAADKTYDEISAAIESGMSVVIHRKTNIDSATYKVFYHSDTGNGFYKFCHVQYGKIITVHNMGIRMVGGEMAIDIQSKEIQVSTS